MNICEFNKSVQIMKTMAEKFNDDVCRAGIQIEGTKLSTLVADFGQKVIDIVDTNTVASGIRSDAIFIVSKLDAAYREASQSDSTKLIADEAMKLTETVWSVYGMLICPCFRPIKNKHATPNEKYVLFAHYIDAAGCKKSRHRKHSHLRKREKEPQSVCSTDQDVEENEK